MTMGVRELGLFLVCGFVIAGCGPTGGPSGMAVQHPVVTTTPPLGANPGPTPAQSGSAPPAFDRYGNANYDSSGAYIGGHGIGTQVDNPDATTMGIPKADMPDISSMHCTGSSGANAGTMNCSN
jgi:hypothetical protein